MADFKEETLDDLIEEGPEPQEEPKGEAPQEVEPEEPKGEPKEPATVPLAALHEERDKRKADAERLKVLEEELQALKTPQQQQQEKAKAPDMFDDPEGYNAYWENRLTQVQESNQQQLMNERLNISERYAVKEHGQEVVDSMKAWFVERVQRSPGYQVEVLSQADPYEFAIKEYQKDQLVNSVDLSEFEQFKAWKAAQESGEPLKAPSTTANKASMARKTPEPFDADEALEDILNKS